MSSLYSNGPNKDFVIQPYQKHIAESDSLFVASPFITLTEDLRIAANQGKSVCLLAGLNIATSPAALRAVFGIPNLAIRYYTHRFHAKIFLFDSCALIGSSNLTDGGMQSNREATIFIDDSDQVAEVRALCQELWSSAPVLTPEVLERFESSVKFHGQYFDPNIKVEAAVGTLTLRGRRYRNRQGALAGLLSSSRHHVRAESDARRMVGTGDIKKLVLSRWFP